MDENTILDIQNLKLDLISTQGLVHAVRDISFQVKKGEIHGIVGESGCGKTMTARSVLRLHDEKKTFYQGKIYYQSENGTYDILNMRLKDMPTVRGKEISMIFQDPITTLNPLYTVGEQISETLRTHLKMSSKEAEEKAIELLESVGIRPGAIRYKQYPYEFSGGMLQRAIIAMGISCNPKLLIADEPTTALDVTMQAQILELLLELRNQYDMSIVIITHNFGVVAEICDKVSVMYAGQIVESANVSDIFHNPKHPYTRDLIASIPKSGNQLKKLVTIPGFPPRLNQEIKGCAYAERCKYATEKCFSEAPDISHTDEGHMYACHHPL